MYGIFVEIYYIIYYSILDTLYNVFSDWSGLGDSSYFSFTNIEYAGEIVINEFEIFAFILSVIILIVIIVVFTYSIYKIIIWFIRRLGFNL